MELKATTLGKRMAQHPYDRVQLLNAGVKVSGDRHEYLIPFNQLLSVHCKRGLVWGELEFVLPDSKVVRLHGTEWSETQRFYHHLQTLWEQWSAEMSDIAALLTWTNIRFLLEGLGLTLIISALAIACSIVLGAVISIMRGSSSRLLRGFAIAYVELLKNTPLLLWIMFTFFVAQLPPLPAAVLAFTLFTAASVAEIVRGGLASVPAGQYEAARSQGFSAPQMYLYIILPQALRNMVPALLSQFVTTIKDTSYLWGAMALQELMGRGMILMNSYNSTVQIFAIFGLMALIYFVVCFTLSQIVRAYQRRLKGAR